VEKMKVGIVGCGNISHIYLKNSSKFTNYEIVAVADLMIDRAKEQAEKYGIKKAYTTEQLLRDEDVELIINLTIPSVHAEIAIKAMEQGKHVYGEKPLAVTREEGKQMLDIAKEKGVYLGNAPDTFLGAGIQTCKKIIDDGVIGRPLSATAFMMIPGHEGWHPDPAFYYQKGGGPMFDMGPYYLTTLVALLGPMERVTGSVTSGYDERTIKSKAKYGEKIKVETPTQINGVIDFKNGAIASIVTSFDTWHHQLPHIELYGSEGSMVVPDPNTFGGRVLVRTKSESEWREIPYVHPFSENNRGLGIAEMVDAIQSNRPSRVDGEIAFHVLDAMHGFHDASNEGRHYTLTSTCIQPSALSVARLKNYTSEEE
jgi:predicted dehydrogenase